MKLKKNSPVERLYNGIFKENPTLVLMLGMCPTLAVTTSAINGLGMGLSTTAVLVMSNLMISLLRKVIPSQVRMPAYIVIVASFVTMIEMILHAYVNTLYESLGIYIPLIVVNCIILGRAEAYASKNKVIPSIFDGLGMGLGFAVALTIIGLVRELLGAGTVFGVTLLPEAVPPMAIFVLAPGAFFVLAVLTALQNKLGAPSASNTPQSEGSLACGGDCDRCTGTCGAQNHEAIINAYKQAMAKKQAERHAAQQAKKKPVVTSTVTDSEEGGATHE